MHYKENLELVPLQRFLDETVVCRSVGRFFLVQMVVERNVEVFLKRLYDDVGVRYLGAV